MKKNNLIINFLYLLLAVASVILIADALGFRRDSPRLASITGIDHALISINGGGWKEESLPLVLKGLPPKTDVSLKTAICPSEYDSVFVQTDYASADIYFDDRLVFQMGKMENYPRIMKIPGREVHMVETYGNGMEKELRIEYHSPGDGGNLILYPPMIGTAKELLMERAKEFGGSFLLSVAQIIGGIAMIIVSAYLALVDRKGVLFLWLGFFSLLTGSWFFCNNNASITYFPQSALLYLCSYIGLFLAPIALFRFVREGIAFEDTKLIKGMEIMFAVGTLSMFVLQILGLISFHKSILVFFSVLFFAVVLLFLLVVREYKKNCNADAKKFILPMVFMVFSSALAFLNLFYPLNRYFAFFHQLGIVLFLLTIAILVGMCVKESLNLQRQMNRLEDEEKLIQIQSEEQRNVALQLVKNEELLSYQRHNLRHHLVAIQELAGDNEELQKYLSVLLEKVPKKMERYCENHFVNAIVSHYATDCERCGIGFSVKLVVPETGSYATDSDLCSIFANILENAVEACERMKEGERFIRIRSSLQNSLLTITMDNSFNGEVTKIGDRFRSAKRNNLGIGLASVQAIAREAHGDATFSAEDRIFSSSVYLSLL